MKDNKKQQENKRKEMLSLNTNEVKFYKNLPYKEVKYNYITIKKSNYDYSYDDVPIHHIIYTGGYKTKNPKLDEHVEKTCKVISITKNYQKGKLDMTLEEKSLCYNPKDFEVYAKIKDIYRDRIKLLTEKLKDLEKIWHELEETKKTLQKGIKSSLEQKDFIKQAKYEINMTTQNVKILEGKLSDLDNKPRLLTTNLKQDEHILDLIDFIIKIASSIGVHANQQHNIDACKRYMNSVKKNNNNININKKHSDYQPGGEDDLEQKNDNDCDNNNNSSSLTSSLLVGGTLLGSVLKKKN